MILDSSAILAILNAEKDAGLFIDALASAKRVRISAPTYVEACMVFAGRRELGATDLVDELLAGVEAQIIPFTADAARVAVRAFKIYGKGRGHKAQLNFGDCMAYAASKVEMMPLLFKGDDFRLTDVEAAL